MSLEKDPQKYIQTIIEERKAKKLSKIQQLLQEIDRLKSEIEAQKQELKTELIETFKELEQQIENLPEPKKSEAIAILDEYKLHSFELLGILAETTESALITTLERGENIKETVFEITKDLAHQTIDINVDARHIKDVTKTILHVAANISEASINYADEILEGAILGVKRGIKLSIEKFYQTIEYTPDEARSLIIENYEAIMENLPKIDEIYIFAIHEVAQRCEPGIKEKMETIASKSESLIEKLKNEADLATALLKSRFEEFLNESNSIKLSTQEAKKLGIKAFSKAKEKIEAAIQGAKDALGK